MTLEQAERFRQQKRAEGATTDGCTFAPEVGTPCCEMHDFLRRYRPDGITSREADKLLRQCLQEKGHYTLGWVYWAAARVANMLGVYN